jgi:thiol-disulfide isomerase/thioredoxin
MSKKLIFFLLLCTFNVSMKAQPPLFNIGLNIGDAAPPLKIKAWVKGTPVERFDKHKIYVLDFWATWCKPCLALMPHYSDLAHKYKGKATSLSIDIYEKKEVSVSKIKKLVDSMGSRMDFAVGIEDNKFMSKHWADTSRSFGIPNIFIVNDGKIDWIGHPRDADSVLSQILKKTWRPDFALVKRSHQLYLWQLEVTAAKDLASRITRYKVNITGNTHERYIVSPDSVLIYINEMVRNIPALEFLPIFVARKFQALLQTDVLKAEDFARKAMHMPGVYDDPPYLLIVNNIEQASVKTQLPESIYKLGIECCQAWIARDPYPELGLVASTYKRMAGLYRQLGDSKSAAEAENKAITRKP